MRSLWALILILVLGGAAAAFYSAFDRKPEAPSAPPAPPKGAEPTLPTSEMWPPAKIVAGKAERKDGAWVLDGQYRVPGAGTADDPFVVPFELLMSAGDVYDPRKGLTKMPQRVAFLHGQHVRITGYIAFPITATDAHQMLVMFNQWDGCCIGVPPTTYDSIETNLAKAAEGDEKLVTYATVTGVLKVDPYVDNGWLLGLYVLDQATFVNADDASPAAQPAPLED